jgi:probable biosynthetic protein (TIGR04098 family)
MLIEDVELTYSHVGLGELGEVALVNLFAAALAHRLTAGREVRLPDVVDTAGQALYPAYYRTHVRVSPRHLLRSFRLWDRVAVGVAPQLFGGMLIEAEYQLGRPGEIGGTPSDWRDSGLPWMRGSNLFVVSGARGEPQVSRPRAGQLAELPKLAQEPDSMRHFRTARSGGIDLAGIGGVGGLGGLLATPEPLRYALLPGRDAAPGANAMFSKFVEILDAAEHGFLTAQLWPPLPVALADSLTLLERELYFFANCGAHEEVLVTVEGRFEPCPASLHGSGAPAGDTVPAGLWSAVLEVYHAASRAQLAACRTVKLLAVPAGRQSLLRDAERLLSRYASPAAPDCS